MITFALFMIREIYCKLNSNSGNTLSIERISDRIYSKTVQKSDLSPEETAFLSEILSEQQQCQTKAEKKLPTWIKHQCLFASVPLEQCTSETVADAKASLFSGKTMLSITGGLGVDDALFAKNFGQITSLDPDAGLNAIARFNNKRMQIGNINRLDTTAEEFLLKTPDPWSLIYADPDRRASGNRMATNVAAYSPDIISLYKQYGSLAEKWIIKLSPMTDMQWFEKQMGQPVNFYVFSERSEVKELLAVLAHNIHTGVGLVHCDENGTHIFKDDNTFPFQTTESLIFCEMTSGAIKAGMREYIIEQTGLKAVSRHGYYLTGNTVIPSALGRCFALKHQFTGSLNHIGDQLKKMGIVQANVSARDFVLPAEEARKKLQLKDGGDVYLFFTGKEVKTCYVTEKLR
jgi:hypothetical protein